MTEPNNHMDLSKPIWGITISEDENNIEISISSQALLNLKRGSWLFGILFFLTMLFSLFICMTNVEESSFNGVLQANEWVALRLPDSSAGSSLSIDEILIKEGSFVASGQALVRFNSPTGSSSFLMAPTDGIVESVNVNISQGTDSENIICRLTRTGSFTFYAKAPEASLEKLALKKTCNLRFTAYPERNFSGTIEEIGAKGEYDASLGYSLFPISIRVGNSDRLLRIGMSGIATVN